MRGKRLVQQSTNEQVGKILELIRLTQKKLRNIAISISKRHGITFVQLSAIVVLRDNPGISLNELSQKMGLSKSTVSAIVERLEEKGIVTREIPVNNRRTVKLSVSREYLDRCSQGTKENEIFLKYTENIRKLSDEDANAVINGLEKLFDCIED